MLWRNHEKEDECASSPPGICVPSRIPESDWEASQQSRIEPAGAPDTIHDTNDRIIHTADRINSCQLQALGVDVTPSDFASIMLGRSTAILQHLRKLHAQMESYSDEVYFGHYCNFFPPHIQGAGQRVAGS